MAQEEVIRDFSYVDAFHPFRVGEDVFHALPDIPLSMMSQVARLSNIQAAIAEQGEDAIVDLFSELLEEPSAALFRERVKTKRIGVKKITEILPWILEKNGLRPTQPSSDSSDGSEDGKTGISSTDGAPLAESTH